MTPKEPRLSLILPCYNEMEHIESSLKKISDFLLFIFEPSEFEIILIDDLSTDGTRQYLGSLKSSTLRVFYNEKNMGRGAAVKQGMKISRGHFVGFMDIDCEVSEAYLAKFILEAEAGADFVIANRIYKVSPSPYILLRHTLSVGYKFLLSKLINCKTHDSEAGFKFFSRRFTEAILQKSQFDDWFWDTEVTLLAEYWGCTIREVGVAFQRNPLKTSTVRIFRDSYRYLVALAKFRRLRDAKAYQAPVELTRNDSPAKKLVAS